MGKVGIGEHAGIINTICAMGLSPLLSALSYWALCFPATAIAMATAPAPMPLKIDAPATNVTTCIYLKI